MNKLGLLKDVVDLVVSIGVSSVVGNAIKMTTDPESKLPKKIAIGIGGFVLSHMVADMAAKYSGEKIDSMAESVNKITRIVSTTKDIVTQEIQSDEADIIVNVEEEV